VKVVEVEQGVAETKSGEKASQVKRTFNNSIAHRVQLRHFIYFWAFPNIAAVALLPVFGIPTGFEVALFLTGWLITTLGVSVGFHRLFTHKAFKTYSWVETALAVAAMMAGGGSLVSWVAIHRRHHEKSDVEGDPHSPLGAPPKERKTLLSKIAGYFHSHSGWMRKHEYPNPLFYCRDLYRKPVLMWVSKRYHWWVLLGLIVPAIANGLFEMSWMGALRGFYYGGLLRLVLVHHFISAVNSVCHGFGSTRYDTGDKSTNCWWLAIPTVGESWHNNHHGKQTSAYFGHAWWEIDLGGILVWSMSKCGVAWDVHGYAGRANPDPHTHS